MSPRRGFTLIEVLVALVLSAVVITGATAVLGAIADQADRVAGVAREQDSTANGERLLRSLVANIQSDTAAAVAFSGDGGEIRATSWCIGGQGYPLSCSITLSIAHGDSGATVKVELPTGETETLLHAPPDAHFAFLSSAAEGGTWYSRWGAAIVAPLAIGLVSARDTIVLRIGKRS